MDVPVPQELASLLERIKDFQAVHTPRLNLQRVEERVTPESKSKAIPANIDLFPFSRFVRENFKDPNQWGVLSNELPQSLTRTVTDQDIKFAVALNRMILRYMSDKNLKGVELKLYSDYLAATILSNYHLRDEALAQIVSLTWNTNEDSYHKDRLWLLLAHCLSCIMPSPQLHPHLLKYVSDHGMNAYPVILQQKLLRMPQNSSPSEKRLFPPSILEWQSNFASSPMAMKIYLPNDSVTLVEVNSWTTAEEAANRAVESKLGQNVKGWSLVLEDENGQIIEVSGHDYLFDLFSHIEMFLGLKTPQHEFVIYPSTTQSHSTFDAPEFSQTRKQSTKSNYSQPERNQQLASSQRSLQGGGSSNFSYGPPNIRMISDPYTEYRKKHSVHNMHADPSTGMIDNDHLSNRIKGGGRMMQPMGMGGGMMMQPQMMPMMQNPMMQNPMMQNPMMQQPQMMMQPQMMPMQNMQMMQHMMQPQMTMPMQQQMPMTMPTSMGMMSTAMDPNNQQQATMQQQMQKLLKKQEEQDNNVKKLLEETKKAREDERKSFRDKSTRDDRKYRRDSSSEDRRPSFGGRNNQYSSDEEKRRRSDDRRSSHRRHKRYSSDEEEHQRRRDSGRRPKAAAVVTTSYLTKQDNSAKPQFSSYKDPSDPTAERFKRTYSQPRSRKEEDLSEIANKGQGTVRMSFNEKRKLFEQKALAGPPQSHRKAPPKKIDLPTAEEQEIPRHYSDRESDKDELSPARQNLQKNDTHNEALKLAVNAAKRNQDKKKQTTEELALLSRQRREAARKQSVVKEHVFQTRSRSQSPEPLRKPKPFWVVTPERESSLEPVEAPTPHPSGTKLKPQRITPVREPTKLTQRSRASSTSSDSTLPSSPRDPSPPVIAGAALVKVLSEKEETEEEEEQSRESSPSPPPIKVSEPALKTTPVMRRDDAMKTVAHAFQNPAPHMYVNVRWKIRARKEVFYHGEYIKDLQIKRLIFCQIARESKNRNPRILATDLKNINQGLMNSAAADVEISVLESILQKCQQAWPVYFTQIFRIKVREVSPDLPRILYQATAVGIGQTGVHFIMINGADAWKTHTYDFSVVSQVKGPQNTILEFSIEGKNVSLHCRKSSQLKKLIVPYLGKFPPKPLESPPTTPRNKRESLPQHDAISLGQQEPQENIYDVLPAPKGTQFSLLVYAKQHFKKPKEAEKSLQYSKVALSKPLLDIKKQEEAIAALECFKFIQQFMGDAPMRSTTEQALVVRILYVCGKHRSDVLLDEVCIYFAKQLTLNKRSQSCLLGWRLFSLFLAYFKCSKSLMPHLLAHLHGISQGTDATGAKVCLINLQQTDTYGGRQQRPSDVELKSLVIGQTTFDLLFFIPGWAEAKFKVNTSTVIMQAVVHFCSQLGITDENDMKEFGVFSILMEQDDKVANILPQKRNTYLLDLLNYMQQNKTRFILAFQRIVWKKQINYNNEKLVLMLFNQAVSEYVDGKYLTYQEIAVGLTKVQFAELVKIGSLLHRGFGGSNSPTLEKVMSFVPRKAFAQQPESTWKKQFQDNFAAVQKMSPHEARSEVLALLAKRKFFGATFFTARITDSSGKEEMKMISIGAENLCIFDPGNHQIKAEHGLSSISNVEVKMDNETNSSACDISIDLGSGVSEISLKTPKATVIAGVLNHHIQVALT